MDLESGVVELEGGVDLAAALHGLLVELGGAAVFAVEGGLEAVVDVKEQIDGADGVGVGGDALQVAALLKVEHGGAGGKDPPVDSVGKGLLLREAERRAGWGKRGQLLAGSQEDRRKGAEDGSCGALSIRMQGC